MGFQTKWILIVDDEQAIRDSVRELLNVTFGEDELRILEARDGLEAASKVKNQQFDCIITDMKMPKKEGDALIVSVRQNPMNMETPIIMLTAYPNKRILREFRFVYLMEKPFLHNELTELVATQLKIGNQGGRLAADMVNGLVTATKMFLETAISEKKDDVVIESPLAKKAGDDVEVEFASQVNILDEGTRNSFSILVKEEDLKNLSKQLTSIQNKPLKEVGFALGQSILKFAMRSMRHSGAYKVNSLAEKEAHQNLINKKGIIIPIRCGDVLLRVLASGEKRKAS